MVAVELTQREAAVIIRELGDDEYSTPMGPQMGALNVGYAKLTTALAADIAENGPRP